MLAAALLAVLTSAPADAARIAAVRCLPAGAAAEDSGPLTLDQLRECQDKARAKAVRKARQKGRSLTAVELEGIDEQQRAETRRFLAQDDAVIEEKPTVAAEDAPAQSSAQSPRSDLPAAAKPGQLGGATKADLQHLDAGSAAAVAALQTRLHAAAGDGSKGITPDMSADIIATLTQAQGGVSPDMKALLDAVAKDGGKLTPDTMKLLQGAGAAAKGEGLDLNIDPEMEKGLLKSDFEDDKRYFTPSSGGGAPSSPGSL
jgi:hypothetical protein